MIEHLLRIPLSDIITSSYLAALYPGCMLFIFGLTPTFDPPVNKYKNTQNITFIDESGRYIIDGHSIIIDSMPFIELINVLIRPSNPMNTHQ